MITSSISGRTPSLFFSRKPFTWWKYQNNKEKIVINNAILFEIYHKTLLPINLEGYMQTSQVKYTAIKK